MANKAYIARETPTVWSDTAGDLAITLNNLAAGAGRVGARKDFGAGSTSQEYSWRLTVQFETTPVVGETVEVYLATSDGTRPDGEVGTADAALSAANKRKNLMFIGVLIVDVATVDIDFTASGVCRIPTRYVSPVIYNATADNLQATNDTGEFTLTPIPPEVQ
jgi:hypothetical protein